MNPFPIRPSRRRWLAQATGVALGGMAPWSRLAWSAPAGAGAPRLVLVLLRGALDGLSAVPAPGDPAYAAARGDLGVFPLPPRPLDGHFALHPGLEQLHAMYGRRELLVLHAIGQQSYRERSHFDAQQMLEAGGLRPFDRDSGWLGRALQGGAARGMAFQPAVPLVLRGGSDVDTWTPGGRSAGEADDLADLAARVQRMYVDGGDTLLAAPFERARRLHADALPAAPSAISTGPATMALGSAAPTRWATLGQQAATFIAAPNGPQVAVIVMGGWDSHANQAAPAIATTAAAADGTPRYGTLGNNLVALDQLLGALRDGLQAPRDAASSTWARTLVLVVTEFGRTVAMNGTRGTDHGSGAAAFALGGAVDGGRVLADWPGLAAGQRFEGRDLRSTTDLRALFKTALHQHLRQPLQRVQRDLLPGSEALPLLPLLRG